MATRTMSTYHGPVSILDHQLGMNGTYYRWDADLLVRYTVLSEGWHNVIFQFCGTDKAAMPAAKMDGYVSFRNPYGYLPAELYGLLPFEAARAVAFSLMGFVFFVLFLLYRYTDILNSAPSSYHHTYILIAYRDSAIPLHFAILFVFSIACIESGVWFGAYEQINRTGTPYCCPFPTIVVAGLVLQIFRQTVSRCLLLIVALGYGVVRPKLMPQEWTAVVIVSLLYFVAAGISQVSEIVLVNDVHEDAPQGIVWYQAPELVMDVIFLSWIYFALTSTIRILTEYKQTQKLHMYRWLTGVIYFFAFTFTVVTVVVMLNKLGYISWPWKWAWVQQVMWEVLNFAVLSCVCAICRPSENSKLLAYASQLPTDDPDDDSGELELAGGTGIDDGEDDDDNGDGDDFEGFGGSNKRHSGSNVKLSATGRGRGGKKDYGFDTLPESDDYGLEEDV